jgi:hypothetical protein
LARHRKLKQPCFHFYFHYYMRLAPYLFFSNIFVLRQSLATV